jgi:hypothetical protein
MSGERVDTQRGLRIVSPNGHLGIARLYGVDSVDIVTYVPLEKLLALKFTIRRSRSSGSPGDSDIFGAQQYAPLLDLVVPWMGGVG